MVDQLKGLFGGGSDDDAKKSEAENQVEKVKGKVDVSASVGDKNADDGQDDFVKRYTTGDPNEGYSEDEAKQEFDKVMKSASPEDIQMALKKTVENLPENQRAELGQMMQDRQQGKNTVQIQRTGDGVATTETQTDAGGGGLDDIIGSLFGGSSGSGSGGGGIGDILGGLLGGSSSGAAQSGATAGSSSGGGMGDLIGGLLSGPQGKAIMGGIAAFAMQAMQGNKDDKK